MKNDYGYDNTIIPKDVRKIANVIHAIRLSFIFAKDFQLTAAWRVSRYCSQRPLLSNSTFIEKVIYLSTVVYIFRFAVFPKISQRVPKNLLLSTYLIKFIEQDY